MLNFKILLTMQTRTFQCQCLFRVAERKLHATQHRLKKGNEEFLVPLNALVIRASTFKFEQCKCRVK